ncbi:GNAT family N-acetyltransferase [Vibrio hyugaensis]|uniref:GNAT family N-acetyltransferase n=1 Tax=Vibrio hyugaensis TaxID=1534743 RepID=UPI001FD1AFA5|nr:GNAT family N-acetyltransferase [Vibrio hyugaensis]
MWLKEMLKSKTIQLRLVQEEDAEFITELRSDEKYNTHLSKSDTSVDAQKLWIRAYKEKEQNKEQFYFIVERLDGTKCGTVRLYDFRSNSFCWGSWILNHNKTRYAALESALLVYKFGFEELEFDKCHFDVRKDNHAVNKFHEKFGARRIDQTELDYLYEIYPEDIEPMKLKCEKILGKS